MFQLVVINLFLILFLWSPFGSCFSFFLPLVANSNGTFSNLVLFKNLVLEVKISEMLLSLECFSPTDYFFP